LNSNIDHMKCSLSSKNSPRNTVDFEAACSVYIRFRGVNGYAWGAVGGAARVERAFSLYAEMRAMLEFQVRKRHPELSEKEIAWKVARLMYLSDEGTQRLLEQARAKLC